MLKSFDDIVNRIRNHEAQKVAVAAAADDDVLASVIHAKNEGIALPILIGSQEEIQRIAQEDGLSLEGCEIIDIPDPVEASAKAVELVRTGQAATLMKGLVSTSIILKAALNRDTGIRKGKLLSHLAMFYSPRQERFLFVSDPAISIAPDVDTKQHIIENGVEAMHLLGYEDPKVGCICAIETVNPAMQHTLDAEELVRRNQAGEIKCCTVSGPFALDNALSKKSAEIKGISWSNAGEIEFLLMPQIEAGNVLYKAMSAIAGLDGAGVVLGARCPIILTSRADNEASKFNSIALAIYLAMEANKQENK